MIITCPACSSRYVLAESLLGPGGARVRCPRCGDSFVVAAVEPRRWSDETKGAESGEAVAESRPPDLETASAAPESRSEASNEEPAEVEDLSAPVGIARALIARLDRRDRDALQRAHARSRLFSQFGPELLDLFDAYRDAAPGSSSRPFLEALRRDCGIDLEPNAT
jgi:predicted Zn finger-like uncharacterized protein